MELKSLPYILSADGRVLLSVDETVEELCVAEGVEELAEHAFSFCPHLKVLSLPGTVRRFSGQAFSGCMISSLHIPRSVESIGENCFSGCMLLESIEVDEENPLYSSEDGVLYSRGRDTLLRYPPKRDVAFFEVPIGVREIKSGAFEDSALSRIILPETLEVLGEGSFSFCRNLRVVPSFGKVAVISDLCFLNCVSLKEVILPETLESIGGCAFFGCQSLTSLRIPFGVKLIDEKAFEDCFSLSQLYCYIINPYDVEVNELAFEERLYRQCTLHVPGTSIGAYRSHPVWGRFEDIVALSFGA